jgi:pSer/pThr/pTyr-binding forkhead associated (FHA) protein
MRLGSLEILAALALFGAISARVRAGAAPARAKAMSLALSVREGASRAPAREVAVPLAEGLSAVIGRAAEADLTLPDPEVSRRHARLDLVRGVVYLADLRSSNGTFLNGKALDDESIELRPGDDIDVGNTRITVLSMEPSK